VITEIIRYRLTCHTPQQLISAYSEAGRVLMAAPECLGFELAECEEEPAFLILRISWKSKNGPQGVISARAEFPRIYRSCPAICGRN
jgi:hypothetical protein